MNGKQRSSYGRHERTAYHFQPAKNWMNGAAGPMYYNGLYHLFFEHNPHEALFGTCTLSWGHSVSGDLVNWTFLGTALDPSLPFDAKGCWSGSATVMPDGLPVLLYTGRGADDIQVQNIAFPKNPSDPLLREWPKDVGNPALEPGPYQKNFRDPSSAWLGRDGLWRVAVSAEIAGVGSILIYRSSDFVHWKRNPKPFYATPDVPVWECPDLFPVAEHGTEGLDTSAPSGPGVRHVFKLTKDKDEDYYVVGWYDDVADTFVPVEEEGGGGDDGYNWRRVDYGHVFGGKSFYDARKKRRVFWVWMDEMDSRPDNIAKGWAGIMIFPRVWWLDTDGKQLVQWPVEEIETLRRRRVALHGEVIGSGGMREIAGIDTLQADVEVVFEIPNLEEAERLRPKWLKDPRKCAEESASTKGGVGPFGLVVMASGDMREQTTVFFRVFEHNGKYKVLMCTDLTRSSTKEGVRKPFYAGFVDVDVEKDRSISLRTLIDHSVIESFGGGGRAVIAARVYPEHVAAGASTHLYVFNDGPEAVTVSKLEAWELATASVNVEDDDAE
ncbi:hypothetical protein HU200_032793 [Digitaria exilis]|uniref:Uncharacterized protein n=1 Tax=Digitaria exilis TaxID=1010633 RepID=A0A835BJ32_9POAL|nr:hypothetical protein HU200_032793 [Digitaria exilis]